MTPGVLVIGLGPAGASAAAAAARAGLRVLAIDRRKTPGQPVQCAEFVPAMLDQELGALDRVTNQRIARMTTFVETDEGDITANFTGRMIDRAAFDAALVERALAAGATCRFDVIARRIAADGSVTLDNGETLRPRVLIGADGPRSRVGAAIGSVNRDLVETRQVRVPLCRPHDATDIFLSAEIPGGYAWLFPQGDEANLGIGAAPSARTQLKRLLENLRRSLVREGRIGAQILEMTGGPIPVGGPIKPIGRLGETTVMLVGDAGGLTNPVTGAGIASAVQSGHLAGDAAAAWLRGDAHALDDYAGEIDAVFGPALARALRRRRELLAQYGKGLPTRADLRRGWIAYPEYWTT